jgi:hypothetical protein
MGRTWGFFCVLKALSSLDPSKELWDFYPLCLWHSLVAAMWLVATMVSRRRRETHLSLPGEGQGLHIGRWRKRELGILYLVTHGLAAIGRKHMAHLESPPQWPRWLYPAVGWIVRPSPHKRCTEILPDTSECDCIWRQCLY